MPDRIPVTEENIRRRVIWPLGITLVFFLALFLAVFQIYLQQELSRQLENHVSSVSSLYSGILTERSDDMQSMIDLIKRNEDLAQAMADLDREKLFTIANPIYRELMKSQSFTHFYFHSTEGVNVLRVHKPERYGDLIERQTMQQARKNVSPSSGIELGPLGTFTLRTVVPWFYEKRLIGFIELGEEVEPLLELVASQSNAHMAVLIKKTYLNRTQWEEGQEMLGRSAEWDLLSDYVITAATEDQLLATLKRFSTGAYLYEEKTVELSLKQQRYRGRFLPLYDVSGQEVGYMLILQNVNTALYNHDLATALVVIFCVMLGGALFVSAYTILGRAEHALVSTREKLLEEIENTHQANTQLGLEIGEKRAAEEALKKAHAELEKKVIERTAQLEQQNKLLENLVSNIPSHVAWKDLDRAYLGCNAGYAELAGSTADAVVGKKDSDLDWHPEFQRFLTVIEDEVLAGNRPVLDRELLDPRPGRNNYYLCSTVPMINEAGKTFGLVSILQDITQQKEKQQLLQQALTEARQANDRISGVMRSVDDALFVIDSDDNILLMNESAGTLLRLKSEEVIGRKADQAIWLTSLRDKVMAILHNRSGGVQFDFEIGEPGTASSLIMQARSSVLRDPQGRYEGMIFLARDVTRDRSMDRLKSDFISVAAHELRTPLATILGFAELLIDDNVPEETDRKDFVRAIFEKAESLSRLLDDMLDISRIESGRGIELFFEKTQVGDLFLPTIRQYRKRVTDRTFEVNLEDTELLLQADPEKISQVMENLLSNAVKYSAAESEIRVEGESTVDGYRLAISDTGIGMTPEQIAHAFDKFYRGDMADRAIKGTGLGLTIVKHIVEQHEGSVHLESRPGEGTTVCFYLPTA